MGDGCRKIFLNTKGKNDDEAEQTLIDFLQYVEHSTDENVPDGCDERLLNLHKKINNIKSNEQMEVTYMKMEERDRLIREEGHAQGTAEGEERVLHLNRLLIAQKRYDDLERASKDKDYRDQLYKEFEI